MRKSSYKYPKMFLYRALHAVKSSIWQTHTFSFKNSEYFTGLKNVGVVIMLIVPNKLIYQMYF